jgi:hypothetical protein
MTDESIKILISRYLDGQLDETEKAEAEKLIAELPEYAEYYHRLKELENQIDSFDPGGDDEFWSNQKDSVLNKISEAEKEKVVDIRPEKSRGMMYKLAAVAASIALVAFISIYESQEESSIKGPFDKPETAMLKKDTTRPVLMSLRPEVKTETSEIADEDASPVVPSPGETATGDDVREKQDDKVAAYMAMRKPDDGAAARLKADKKKGETEAKEEVDAVNETEMKRIVVEADRDVYSSYAPSTEVFLSREMKDVEESAVQPDVDAISESEQNRIELHAAGEGVDAARRLSKDQLRISKEVIQSVGLVGSLSTESANAGQQIEPDKGQSDSYAPGYSNAESLDGEMIALTADMPDSVRGSAADSARAVHWRGVIDSLDIDYSEVLTPHYRMAAAKARNEMPEDEIRNIVMTYARAYFQVGAYSHSADSGAVYSEKLKNLLPLTDPSYRSPIENYIEKLETLYK